MSRIPLVLDKDGRLTTRYAQNFHRISLISCAWFAKKTSQENFMGAALKETSVSYQP